MKTFLLTLLLCAMPLLPLSSPTACYGASCPEYDISIASGPRCGTPHSGPGNACAIAFQTACPGSECVATSYSGYECDWYFIFGVCTVYAYCSGGGGGGGPGTPPEPEASERDDWRVP